MAESRHKQLLPYGPWARSNREAPALLHAVRDRLPLLSGRPRDATGLFLHAQAERSRPFVSFLRNREPFDCGRERDQPFQVRALRLPSLRKIHLQTELRGGFGGSLEID